MHEPVLVKEALDALYVKNQEWYIDGTLGAAGHAIEILKIGGNVVGIDQDPSMIEIAQKNIIAACPVPKNNFGDFKLLYGNFTQIDELAHLSGINQFSGILLDLGVSNVHYADKSRGFSFSDPNASLDMRLDRDTQGVKASDFLNGLREDQLFELFLTSMDYPQAKSLVKRANEKRNLTPFVTIGDFLELFHQKPGKVHPATKGLMALRIAVNSELENIKIVLPKALELLKPEGRLVVITFHSTEDRLVKHIFSEFVNNNQAKHLYKDAVVPTLDEIEKNKKARSAKLRGIIKI